MSEQAQEPTRAEFVSRVRGAVARQDASIPWESYYAQLAQERYDEGRRDVDACAAEIIAVDDDAFGEDDEDDEDDGGTDDEDGDTYEDFYNDLDEDDLL